MASSQHRCVFVGNIPYDATEEQLIQICEEVGPVVSFRLVTDKESGRPKGYGFCEYKDEETALSARRNLQGYEINGRQLRVDFAENDKGTERNREQGRGGPGLTGNADIQQKQPLIAGDPAPQPIGLPLAMSAASVMAGILGGPQSGKRTNQSGSQYGFGLGSDPLTLHLAKMSRNQLNQIMSELKGMSTQSKDLARQLLLVNPQLSKALFQAQVMLGMVSPEMLQTANIPQVPLGQGIVRSETVPIVQISQPSSVISDPIIPTRFPPRPITGKLLQTQMPLKPEIRSNLHTLPEHPMGSLGPSLPLLPSRGKNARHLSIESVPDFTSARAKQAKITKDNVFSSGFPVVSGCVQPEAKLSTEQLPPEMASLLLEQVMKLTPEQLSSLPPEQQQEVLQLQQMLR